MHDETVGNFSLDELLQVMAVEYVISPVQVLSRFKIRDDTVGRTSSKESLQLVLPRSSVGLVSVPVGLSSNLRIADRVLLLITSTFDKYLFLVA